MRSLKWFGDWMVNALLFASLVVPVGLANATQQGRTFERSAELSRLSIVEPADSSTLLQTVQDETEPAFDSSAIASTPRPFGAADSWRWTVQSGGGFDLQESDNVLGFVGVGVSYFLIENLSFNVELNGLFARQSGSDAGGVNFNVLLRWHALDFGSWGLYADGGAGLLLTLDDVPADGSEINFTPQLGAGVSVDLSDRVRLLAGVRWHHISNANMYRSNPGRDSALFYAMVSLPF